MTDPVTHTLEVPGRRFVLRPPRERGSWPGGPRDDWLTMALPASGRWRPTSPTARSSPTTRAARCPGEERPLWMRGVTTAYYMEPAGEYVIGVASARGYRAAPRTGVRRHRVGRTRRPRSDAGPPGITCRGGPWVGHLVMLDASTFGRSPPPKTARRTSRSPKPSSSTSPSPAAFSRSTTPRPDPPRTSNARARCTLQQLPGSAAGDSGYSGDDGRRRCHHRPERRDRHLTRRRRPTPR
jgi:hypothetical protein